MRVTASSRRPWHAAVRGRTAHRARQLARDVAHRLRDTATVETAAAHAAAQSTHPATRQWEPCGVAQGFAGTAILAGAMESCFPGESWEKVAHAHLERAARGAVEIDVPAGIFSGLSGLAFATSYLSRDATRYSRLTTALDAALLPRVHALVSAVPSSEPTGVAYFDLISGLSGVGAWLLRRMDSPPCVEALRVLVARLVALSAAADGGLPRWWTPDEFLTPESRATCPDGNLNCGLAHGIPGPLALMSLASIAGLAVDGLDDAIDRTAQWLCAHRADDAWGVNWPYAVPVDDRARVAWPAASADCPEAAPSRAAWCYGAPGVARSLALAGRALGCERYRSLAVAAMHAAIAKPVAEREISSPTFCHGVAGLLQVILRFAHDEQAPELEAAADTLCRQLLDLHGAAHPFGWRSEEESERFVDNPGLLDGAAGVVLVLLAAATDEEPVWDRMFLLS